MTPAVFGFLAFGAAAATLCFVVVAFTLRGASHDRW